MKQARSTKIILLKSSVKRLSEVEEAVMLLLHTQEPLTIEELVSRLPEFRWGDVLQVVSKLWGENVLELEDQRGQLRIACVSRFDSSRSLHRQASRKSQNNLKLTVS